MKSIVKSKKPFIRLFILFIFCTLLAGCAATEWQPITLKMGEISWPPPPHTKVTYVGEINEFEPTSRSLKTILIGKSQAGKIIKPVAVTVGPGGRMAIADQGRKGVHFFDPVSKNYKFLFIAGNEKIDTPVGVAFDDAGNLYVTDSQLNKIIIFDAQATFLKSLDHAGDLPLLRPSGITFNQFDKRIYVSDTMRHQVLVYSRLGEFITRIGQRGEDVNSFNFPTHISSDMHGRIYVTDSMNFRAHIITPKTLTRQTFGHHGNGSGDFASPKGISVDSNGYIYIAETLFDNVQIFSEEGAYMLPIGSQGTGPGQFWMPSGLFIDDNDRLFVCDTYNGRIQIFQLSTGSSPEEKQTQGSAL